MSTCESDIVISLGGSSYELDITYDPTNVDDIEVPAAYSHLTPTADKTELLVTLLASSAANGPRLTVKFLAEQAFSGVLTITEWNADGILHVTEDYTFEFGSSTVQVFRVRVEGQTLEVWRVTDPENPVLVRSFEFVGGPFSSIATVKCNYWNVPLFPFPLVCGFTSTVYSDGAESSAPETKSRSTAVLIAAIALVTAGAIAATSVGISAVARKKRLSGK
jgi:hypothetical protein